MDNVSFITPAYNCDSTIEDSLFSIIDGNISDGDEIVVCDDGSSDNTSKILEKLSSEYNFIKVIKHERNLGGASARNTAIKNTRNNLIFCLDSDNLLLPGSVEKLKKALIFNNADVSVFGEIRFFNEDINSPTHTWIFPQNIFTLADHLSGHICPGASGNYLFTKNIWEKSGGYPEFSKSLDAWGFGFRQLAVGGKMIVVKDVCYLHRYGHESYWVREANKGICSIATKIIKEFDYLINVDDILYVDRNNWFGNLDNRGIRLKNGEKGETGLVVYVRLKDKIKSMLRAFVNNLLFILKK